MAPSTGHRNEDDSLEEGEIASPVRTRRTDPASDLYETISEVSEDESSHRSNRRRTHRKRRTRGRAQPRHRTPVCRDRRMTDFDEMRKRYMQRLKENRRREEEMRNLRNDMREKSPENCEEIKACEIQDVEMVDLAPSVPLYDLLSSQESEPQAPLVRVTSCPDSEEDINLQQLRDLALKSQRIKPKISDNDLDSEDSLENDFSLRAEALKTVLTKRQSLIQRKKTKNKSDKLKSSVPTKRNVQTSKSASVSDVKQINLDGGVGKENSQEAADDTIEDENVLREQLLATISKKGKNDALQVQNGLACAEIVNGQRTQSTKLQNGRPRSVSQSIYDLIRAFGEPESPDGGPTIVANSPSVQSASQNLYPQAHPLSLPKPSSLLESKIHCVPSIAASLEPIRNKSTNILPQDTVLSNQAKSLKNIAYKSSLTNPTKASSAKVLSKSNRSTPNATKTSLRTTVVTKNNNSSPIPTTTSFSSIMLSKNQNSSPNSLPTNFSKTISSDSKEHKNTPTRIEAPNKERQQSKEVVVCPPKLSNFEGLKQSPPTPRSSSPETSLLTKTISNVHSLKRVPQLPKQHINRGKQYPKLVVSKLQRPAVSDARIVIRLGQESSSDEDNDAITGKKATEPEASLNLLSEVDQFLLNARRRHDASIPPTPEAVQSHLPPDMRLEYVRLKQKLAEKEKNAGNKLEETKSGPASPALNEITITCHNNHLEDSTRRTVDDAQDLRTRLSGIKRKHPETEVSTVTFNEASLKIIDIVMNDNQINKHAVPTSPTLDDTSSNTATSVDTLGIPAVICDRTAVDSDVLEKYKALSTVATGSAATVKNNQSSTAGNESTCVNNNVTANNATEKLPKTMAQNIIDKNSNCAQAEKKIKSNALNSVRKNQVNATTENSISENKKCLIKNTDDASRKSMQPSSTVCKKMLVQNKVIAGTSYSSVYAKTRLKHEKIVSKESMKLAEIGHLMTILKKELAAEKSVRDELTRLRMQIITQEQKKQEHANRSMLIRTRIKKLLGPTPKSRKPSSGSGRKSTTASSSSGNKVPSGHKSSTACVPKTAAAASTFNQSAPKLSNSLVLEAHNPPTATPPPNSVLPANSPISGGLSKSCDPAAVDVATSPVPRPGCSYHGTYLVKYVSPLWSGTSDIDPMKEMCPHDLSGSCRDSGCPYQHIRV